MGGKKGGLRPRIPSEQPACPLTRQLAQCTLELSPRSRPLTVPAWRLPENTPCILISRPLFWHAPLAQSHLGSPAQPCRSSPRLLRSLRAQGRAQNPLSRRRSGRESTGAPCSSVPPGRTQLPDSSPSPERVSFGSRSARLRPQSGAPQTSLGFPCAPRPHPHPGAVREPASPNPAPGALLGHLGRVHFTSSRGRDCSKTGQREGQKKWKGERLSGRTASSANSPSPAPTLAIPTATFSLLPRFPLGCGVRGAGPRGVEQAGGCGWRAGEKLRAGEWVGGWGRRRERLEGRRGVWGGKGGGDSVLLPLPA